MTGRRCRGGGPSAWWRAGPKAELKTGQIVTVDVQGTGPQAQLTFEGVAKPEAVPDAPPAEIDSKAAAGGTDGRLTNGE